MRGQGKCKCKCNGMILFLIAVVIVVFFPGHGDAYKNYTVGESLGWYDLLEAPKADYQKWASHKNFSLGDFLIFNTDNNHSVVQTYNFTTYKFCNYDDALENDTMQWAEADPSAANPHPVSVAVPLLKTGPTYFFSSDYDGEQCQNGQHFKINVTYGQGLPPSLVSDDSPGPVSQQSGDDDSLPDTLVPSNFDNPKDMSDDDDDEVKPSKSVALVPFSKLFGFQLLGLFILFECFSF